MKLFTNNDVTAFNALLLKNPSGGHILQSCQWGELKSQHGWTPQRYLFEVDQKTVAVQFLVRKILGLGEVWYTPKGPGVIDLTSFLAIIKDLKQNTTAPFMIKLEPEILESNSSSQKLLAAGLIKGTQDLQFKATIIVDLDRTEETILASFKQKTRYNIRLSSRHGVSVKPVPATPSNLEIMYKLMQATKGRAGFFLRPKNYFTSYWKYLSEQNMGQLFFAYHEGKVLAGVFATYFGTKSWYKDGGSFDLNRNLMAPYLLQWETIRWLKAKGAKSYDLVAVPPPAELTAEHPLYGLYQFKSGFNQQITEYIGVWDLPLSAQKYQIWTKYIERLQSAFTRHVKKDLLY